MLYGDNQYSRLGRLGVTSELSSWTGIHGWINGDPSYCWDTGWDISSLDNYWTTS